MKFRYYFVLLLLLLTVCATFSAGSYVKPHTKLKTMHITVPLSDKLSSRYQKYLLYAYNQLGYNVQFEKILIARARQMVDEGRFDALMVAEQEIEQVYRNIMRVPVMLAKGKLVLYCAKKVLCQQSVLNDPKALVGVISGHSISANFMSQMNASTYAVKSTEKLGEMLTKDRLDYILVIYEQQLGNISNFDETNFKSTDVYSTVAYHYIHKKNAALLPALNKALARAIEEYGPLVQNNKD